MDNSVMDDIDLTKEVLRGSLFSDHNMLYFSTNEYLSKILDNFDIKNKKVLTVLGSGDQAFHFYLKGAKLVDLFDNNELAIHYYYLRRWTIIHYKKSYPPFNFDGDFLRNLLPKVTPKSVSEQNAIDYWNEFTNILDTKKISSEDLFHYVSVKYDDTIYDNTNLKDLLINDPVCFSNIDIAQKIKSRKKYDIIYTSNISDYVNITGSFDTFRDNLKKLLRKDGIIICSDISWGIDSDEIESLEKDFNFHSIKTNIAFDYETQVGHYYTRKRLKDRFRR